MYIRVQFESVCVANFPFLAPPGIFLCKLYFRKYSPLTLCNATHNYFRWENGQELFTFF